MAPSRKEARIAVMGATGSGKSTFINLASGSTLPVGRGLHSCTSDVDTSKPFLLDGRIITLIDTPGFDDTTRSETDVLQCIVGYLAKIYEQGTKLAGIVYIHRISDVRMGGTSTRNFRIFRELCGESTLRNVLVVTNFWGKVEPGVGEERENELANNDAFFKPVLKKGARLLRHDGTQASAHAILRQLIGKEEAALQIQKEIVDQQKDLDQTAAGATLARDLTEQARRHEEQLRKFREEMEDALRRKDEETRLEIQEEVNKVQEENDRIKRDSERMASNFAAEKARLESKIAEMEVEHRRRVQELQGLRDEVVQVHKEVETAQVAHAQHEKEMLENQEEAKEETDRQLEGERKAREQAKIQHQERPRSARKDMQRAEGGRKRAVAGPARSERERLVALELVERRRLAEAREQEEIARWEEDALAYKIAGAREMGWRQVSPQSTGTGTGAYQQTGFVQPYPPHGYPYPSGIADSTNATTSNHLAEFDLYAQRGTQAQPEIVEPQPLAPSPTIGSNLNGLNHPRDLIRIHKIELEAGDSYSWKQLLNACDALKRAWSSHKQQAEEIAWQYCGNPDPGLLDNFLPRRAHHNQVKKREKALKDVTSIFNTAAVLTLGLHEVFNNYQHSTDQTSRRRVRESCSAAVKGLPDWPSN